MKKMFFIIIIIVQYIIIMYATICMLYVMKSNGKSKMSFPLSLAPAKTMSTSLSLSISSSQYDACMRAWMDGLDWILPESQLVHQYMERRQPVPVVTSSLRLRLALAIDSFHSVLLALGCWRRLLAAQQSFGVTGGG